MPVLAFKVQADWEKVVRLREEITKLKAEMRGIDAVNSPAAFNTLNQRLKQCTTEFNNLTTEAVQAGAKIESGFKKRIFDAQQVVNGLSEEIIKQRKIVADTTDDLKKLTEQYRNLKANGQNLAASNMLPQLNKVKSALDEQKYALFELTQERAKEQIGVKKLREEYQLFAKDSDAGTDALAKMKSQLLGVGKGLLAGMGLKELAADIIRVRGQFQQADTAIATLLGSEERAKDLLSQVREYAKISPLEFGDITAATQMMLGFNIEAEKVPGFIKAIGDVSMGESSRFNSLTLAFSQMSATGKLMGQDLNQMINAGFNPLQIMSEKTGKSIAQLKDEMSKGAITSEMVQQAFIDATSAGGKFFNMSENAAKTINGQLSMMHDAIDSALNDIGTTSEGMIVGTISGITKLIENYETVGRVLLGLATTYGTYRTAVALVTFAQNGHTLAMTMARAQILLTQKAQALLNATMLANPYVLAAVALGSLLGVVIATSDGLNAAEKAQRDFNETLEDAEKKQADYNAETEKAINLANNDAAATGDRQGAMDLLIKRYPTIIQKYIDEEGHLRNILQLKREIAEIDGQRTVQGYKKESGKFSRYAYLAEQVRKMQLGGTKLTDGEKKEWEEAKKYYYEKNGWTSKITDSASDMRDYFQNMSRNFNNQAERQTAQNSVKKFQETVAGYSEAQLKQLQKVLQTAKGKKGKVKFNGFGDLNGAVLNQGDIAGLDKYVEGLLKAKSSTVVNKDALTKRKKKLQAELEALTVEEAAGKKGKDLKKKIQAIDKQLGSYSTTSSHGGKGGKGTTADDVEEKKTDVLSKQKLAQERAAKDLEFSTREAQIKAMQDGTDKVLAQIELDRDREEEAIRRSYEDMRLKRIEEARKVWEADPKNKGKNFYDTQEYAQANTNTQEETDNRDARMKAAKADYKKALEEQRDMQVQSLRDYLKEYGNIQDQKRAIAEEYDLKIAKASDEIQKALLRKQKENLLRELNMKEFQSSINWEVVFSNFDRLSTEALQTLRDKLRNMLRDGNITPENAKVLSEKILEAENEIANRKDVFANLFPALKERLRITNQIKQAEEEIQTLQNSTNQKRAELVTLISGKANMSEGAFRQQFGSELAADDFESILSSLGIVLDDTTEDGKALTIALADLKESVEQVTAAEKNKETIKGMLKGDKSIFGGIGDIMSNAVEAGGGGLLGIIDVVGANLNSMADFSDKIGLAGTDFGDAVHGFADGVNGFQSAIGALAKGDIFGAVNGVLDGIAGFGKAGISIFAGGGNEDEMEAEIAHLAEVNERLSKTIDSLARHIKDRDNTNKESIDYYKRAVQAENEWEANQRNAIDDKAHEYANSGYGFLGLGGRSSFNHFMYGNDWYGWSRFNEVLRAQGLEGNASKDNFYNLTPEQMQVMRDFAPAEWRALFDNNDGHRSPEDLINSYIDHAGKIEELTSALNEKLTGYSWEGYLDKYKSLLKDLTSETEDFGDAIEEIISNALLESLVNDEFKDRIKNLYKYIADHADDGLDEGELNYIRNENEKIANDMIARRQNLVDAGMIKPSEDEKEQKATANGIEKMTHEDAGVIEGKLTATQIAVEQGNTKKDAILAQTTMMNVTMSDIRSIATTQSEIADDTRTILANSYLELREINEHQDKIEKAVVVIQSDVEEMKEDIKDLK